MKEKEVLLIIIVKWDGYYDVIVVECFRILEDRALFLGWSR